MIEQFSVLEVNGTDSDFIGFYGLPKLRLSALLIAVCFLDDLTLICSISLREKFICPTDIWRHKVYLC